MLKATAAHTSTPTRAQSSSTLLLYLINTSHTLSSSSSSSSASPVMVSKFKAFLDLVMCCLLWSSCCFRFQARDKNTNINWVTVRNDMNTGLNTVALNTKNKNSQDLLGYAQTWGRPSWMSTTQLHLLLTPEQSLRCTTAALAQHQFATRHQINRRWHQPHISITIKLSPFDRCFKPKHWTLKEKRGTKFSRWKTESRKCKLLN